MCFTRQIGHISLHHEMIEHGAATQFLRQQHGHLNPKSTIVCRHRFAFLHHLVVDSASHEPVFPITGIRQPPESHLTAYRIFHLCALHRDTSVCQCLTLGLYGVTSLISFLIISKLHLEGRTLILLNLDTDTLTAGTKGKPSVQQTCRQYELRSTLAIAVGSHRHFLHHLIVGIAQLYPYLFISYCYMVRSRQFLPHDG